MAKAEKLGDCEGLRSNWIGHILPCFSCSIFSFRLAIRELARASIDDSTA